MPNPNSKKNPGKVLVMIKFMNIYRNTAAPNIIFLKVKGLTSTVLYCINGGGKIFTHFQNCFDTITRLMPVSEMIKNAKAGKMYKALKSMYQNGFYHAETAPGSANPFLPTIVSKC